MIFKLITFLLVIFVVYIVFFKKTRTSNKRQEDQDKIDTLIKCPSCDTYITMDDGILSNGKYFCSKECIRKV